jgi:hypothetical protein
VKPAKTGKSTTSLQRSIARMDPQTLNRTWEACLRGDMDLVEATLAAHKCSEHVESTPQWSETNTTALFQRKHDPKKKR